MARDKFEEWNTDDNPLEPLMACPFCGGKAILCDNGYEEPEIDSNTGAYMDLNYYEADAIWVECSSCCAMSNGYGSPKEAVAHWNRRVK